MQLGSCESAEGCMREQPFFNTLTKLQLQEARHCLKESDAKIAKMQPFWQDEEEGEGNLCRGSGGHRNTICDGFYSNRRGEGAMVEFCVCHVFVGGGFLLGARVWSE